MPPRPKVPTALDGPPQPDPYRIPSVFNLAATPSCLARNIAHKRHSIIASEEYLGENATGHWDMWSQTSPPEGGACSSPASTQRSCCWRGRKGKVNDPDGSVPSFLPGSSGGGGACPRKIRWGSRQGPGFQEDSVRGAQGRRKPRPVTYKGIWKL